MSKLPTLEFMRDLQHMVRQGATDEQMRARHCPARTKRDVQQSIEAARRAVERERNAPIRKLRPAKDGLFEISHGHFASAAFLEALGRKPK